MSATWRKLRAETPESSESREGYEAARRAYEFGRQVRELAGDVRIGELASFWFNAVVRGDVAPVVIGKRVNVQDGACVHCDSGVPNVIADDVTIDGADQVALFRKLLRSWGSESRTVGIRHVDLRPMEMEGRRVELRERFIAESRRFVDDDGGIAGPGDNGSLAAVHGGAGADRREGNHAGAEERRRPSW